jgi:hypothetical protein
VNGITFKTLIFTERWSRHASEQVLDVLLEALVQVNGLWLRLNPTTPHPYRAGIQYIREDGTEEWLAIPEIIREGGGDCEDLACWLVAHYRASGIDRGARVVKRFHNLDGFLLYHIVCQRSDGSIEDPSAKLGMNVESPDGYKPVPGVPFAVSRGMTSIVGGAMLGDAAALGQLQRLAAAAQDGDRRAQYLIGIARMIRESDYDPTKSRWQRNPGGAWEWVHPQPVMFPDEGSAA